MTTGEKKFKELKADYAKDYERTTGKKVKKLSYKDGFVMIVTELGLIQKYRIGEFETMCVTLSLRKDFVPKKKVAKLITITLIARVIVDENATDEDVARASKYKFLDKINNNEIQENIDVIMNDEECPYVEGEQ